MWLKQNGGSIMRIVRSELQPGVGLTAAYTDKYKDGLLSIRLLTPLDRPHAALAEILPGTLLRGGRFHRDADSVKLAAEGLGGTLSSGARRIGEIQELSLSARFREEGLLKRRLAAFSGFAALLGELVQTPLTVGGRLSGDSIRAEKERVKAAVPTGGALQCLRELMCPAEAYGAPPLGAPGALERVSVGTLTTYYRRLLQQAKIEIIYVGSLPSDELLPLLRSSFSALSARPGAALTPALVREAPPKGKVRVHRLGPDGEICGLSVGYRLGRIPAPEEHAAYAVLEQLLGTALLPWKTELFLDVIKGVLLLTLPFEAREDSLEALRARLRELSDEGPAPFALEQARQHAAESFLSIDADPAPVADRLCVETVLGPIPAWGDQAAAALDTTGERICSLLQSLREDTVLIPFHPAGE